MNRPYPISIHAFALALKMTAAVMLFASAIGDTCHAQPVPQNVSTDWARWRGPDGNGVASNQNPVSAWSSTKNVLWRTKIPGIGHASPVISGSKIFLATADQSAQTQSVVAVDRATGKQLWQTVVNTGNLPKKIHMKNTHGSATVAVGAKMIYVVFFHSDQKHLTALDTDGKIQWQKVVGNYTSPYEFGVGASPIVHRALVIVPNENMSDGALVAFDAKTGQQKWKAKRPSINYSTPVVATLAGKDQLLISGIQAVTSYDPATGEKLWAVPAKWQATCGTMVWNGDTVFASGGYPVQQTLAVAADGSGKMLWDKPIKCYEQSMIVVEGFLYLISDKGVIFCVEPTSGKEMWKHRFKGPVSASPVFAGGMIYFTAENGETVVIKPNPQKFEEVAMNKLGDISFASFAVADDRIYTRVGERSMENGQWLYCIGRE